MIAEPSRSRQTFAAESCWPFSGRARCIAGRKLVLEPCSDSSERAHARSAVAAKPLRAHDAEGRHRRHELRAVDEGQALLARQANRLEAYRPERGGSVQELTVHDGLPLPHERERQMSERRKVAARPDRSARRHPREHAAVQALEQELDRRDVRARETLRKRIRTEQHRRTHDVVGIRLTHAARVAAQQAELELLRELLRDVGRHEAAESGVHAVGVLAAHAVDELACGAHLLPGRVGSVAVPPWTATSHTSARARSSPVRTIARATPRV